MNYQVGDLVKIKTIEGLKEFAGALGLVEQVINSTELGDCYYILISGENKSIIFNISELERV